MKRIKHYTTEPANKKQWLLTASVDGNIIDYEEIIESDTEPDYWTAYTIAEEHGCEFFTVEELEVLTA